MRRLRPDIGLNLRMTFSLMLLAALYLLFVVVLLRAGIGFLGIVVIAGGLLVVQYYFSDQLILMTMGAKILRPGEEPELQQMVGRLAQLADIPQPKVALVRTDMPNAFATGRDPRHAVVAVTTGLLQRLTDPEVEAVLAHEITHVHNRDMALMTMASFFATIASYIVQMAFWFMPLGGDRDEERNVLIVYLVSFIVWIVSFFLIRAFSRYREYAADRGSAILTGQPSQLMSALVKLHNASRIPRRDLRHTETLQALFIMPAVSKGSVYELFQTHPTLEHRLEHLRKLEQEINR
ncbi:MAG: zinc metalloprotease HtpX [Thermaerobacter sp.]|nr:zinc metalloprotease HtpX [Thermaerobacter sp.]